MWKQSWGTGMFWARLNILFLSLYEGRKKRIISDQKDLIATQSTENRSKKCRAVEKTFPAWTAKPSAIPTNFLWGIFGLEKQMRDIHPRVGSPSQPHWGLCCKGIPGSFLSPWWEGGRKKDPSGNVRRNVAISPLTSQAELSPQACKISAMPIAAPSCSKGFQKALGAPAEEQSLQNWSIFSFFETTLFLTLLSSNI